MFLLIWIEIVISKLVAPLRWIVRRYPKPSFVVIMLAVATLVAQTLITHHVDPKLFTGVFSISLLLAVGMAAMMMPMSIEEDRPHRPRHQPQKIEDWLEQTSLH